MKRMAIYSSVGAILVAVAILFIFCFNARIPESHSWKGYFVVYVDRTIPESEVLTTFSDYGVKKNNHPFRAAAAFCIRLCSCAILRLR